MTANTTTTRRTATGFESRFGGRRCGRVTGTVTDIVKVVGYCIVGIVLVFLIVVDDGVGTNVGNSVAIFIDCGVFGVDVCQIGAVVLIDVTVPCIIVDCDFVVVIYIRIAKSCLLYTSPSPRDS